MGQIKILSEQIANKIAAGEVVERPGSVVKELIENSLDAGAKAISVSVSHGGKSMIRVTDDGSGMDKEDVRHCLLRHATSKISSVEDIERIQTLGFRGEALPSIAAISRLSLITRQPVAETGTSLKATGGVIESVKECMTPPGTSIEVADLFFNTPARKKFLKSEGAEYAAIAEVFDSVSIAFPDVAFTLHKSGVEAAGYPAGGSLIQRIEQIYSSAISEHLLPLNTDREGITISGYIGTPDNTRVNRSGQKFFINRRPVRSLSLSFALQRAYEEFMERDRYPRAILFFEIDPAAVDVNIHPAKREVRLLNERFIQDILIRAIRKTFSERGIYVRTGAHTSDAPYHPAYPEKSEPLSFAALREEAAQWKTAEEPAEGRGEPFPLSKDQSNGREAPAEWEAGYPFGIIRVLGQIHGTYIVAETGDGLTLIDQHAAHERIVYEAIRDSFRHSSPHSQRLLFSLTLHLDQKERSIMEDCLTDFQRIGFGINSLGGGTFAVDAVPAFLADGDSIKVLTDTLHELMEESLSQAKEEREKTIAAALACKTRTVKAGRMLDEREMLHLIRKLGSAQNPHTCPHGRPTMFSVTTHEIEKRFKRR
ncbi:MAG: DNA mismatch repair endonuclease MutL [Proteobacteria bacterium]|nr:DNA mismatch repair endonuclease MutL [Pseudomonadota bacterium]